MSTGKKIAVIAVIALALGFIAGSVSQRSTLPAPQTVKSSLTSIMIDYGDGRVKIYNDLTPTRNESLIKFLERTFNARNIAFSFKEYSGMGALVTKIGDQENGADKKYWQYWVNNKSPDVGVSAYPVQPGDIIEWKFISYTEQ